MTRWARVGSTQKHHKTPGDATPWEEFSKDSSKNSAPKGDKFNQIQKGRIEKKKLNLKIKGSSKFTQFSSQASKENEVKVLVKSESSKGKLFKKKKSPSTDEEMELDIDDQNLSFDIESTDDETNSSPKIVKKSKIKKSASLCLPSIEGASESTVKIMTKTQRKKARRKMKLQEKKLEVMQSMSKSQIPDNVEKEESIENNVVSPDKVLEKKKSNKKRKNKQDEFAADEGTPSNVDFLLIDEKVSNKKLKKSIALHRDRLHIETQNAKSENLVNEDPKRDSATEVKVMTKNQWKKARRKKKLEQLKAIQSSENQGTNLENSTDEKSTPALDKDFLNKKKFLLDKLEKKKHKNGAILLPSKVERKIFNIKRNLMQKGLSPTIIADVVRKERKREEEKFRKTFSTKPCYNCRQLGHLLSECPLKLGDSYQDTGICFKCGSTEHTSHKCPKKVEGYPLAKCFICKEQGHISKDCPKSGHGIYIRGGKCSMCGNVNHLRKDCPSNKKEKKDEDSVITVGTINEGTSVDEEILKAVPTISKKKFKKPKVLKF